MPCPCACTCPCAFPLEQAEARLDAHERRRAAACDAELAATGAAMRGQRALRGAEVAAMRRGAAAARGAASNEAEVVAVEHELLLVEAARLADDGRELDVREIELDAEIDAEATQER